MPPKRKAADSKFLVHISQRQVTDYYAAGRSSGASKRATPVPDIDISSDDDYSDHEELPEETNLKGTVWRSTHLK
jgi:DNA excision repair protein ERCC-3